MDAGLGKLPQLFWISSNRTVLSAACTPTPLCRVAQLGFAAGLIGEALTGKGILAQFDLETGLPLYETEPLLLAL